MQMLSTKNLDSIGWWEFRRLHYNCILLVFIGIAALLSRAIYASAPGNDEISWVFLAAIGGVYITFCNIGYTLNWIGEIIWAGGNTDLTKPFRWRMWMLAVALSMIMSSLLPLFAFLVSLVYRFPSP